MLSNQIDKCQESYCDRQSVELFERFLAALNILTSSYSETENQHTILICVGHSCHPVALIIEPIKIYLLYRLALKLIRPCRELNSASFGIKARIRSCSYDTLLLKEEMLQNFCLTRYKMF